MISSDDLVWMRATQAENLPDTLIVQSSTTTITAEGGSDLTWADGPPGPCRISPIAQQTGDEDIIADKVTEKPKYQLTFPMSVSLSGRNRAKVNGIVYEVESVEDGREHQTVGRALIRRMD